jgi:4-diphosphocytidyl-2-C-methyl-D-erythritol kinase
MFRSLQHHVAILDNAGTGNHDERSIASDFDICDANNHFHVGTKYEKTWGISTQLQIPLESRMFIGMDTHDGAVFIRAYGKINLGLRILRKREDGYHDITTVFHLIDVYDALSIQPSSSDVLECSDPSLPTDERNLCLRAARLFRSGFGINSGVHISLQKSIPVGAGLGGGSSDAAATLLGCARLWRIDDAVERLVPFAIQLGSDVPYFLKPGSAMATGRGEILSHFNLELPYWILIVYPNIHISTVWAYQNVTPSDRIEGTVNLRRLIEENLHNPHVLPSLLVNDFEPLVFRTHPPIKELKAMLTASGAVAAQLSGSGSAVYGLFADRFSLKRAEQAIPPRYPRFISPPRFVAEP